MRMCAIIAVLGAVAAWAEPIASYRWTVDVSSDPRPVAVSAMRGVSLALECSLADRGKPVVLPDGASAVLSWQTNGMDSAWWHVPAVVTGSVLKATWTPSMDAGASSVVFFISAKVPSGELLYRAYGRMALIGAPGAIPNELPFPRKSIDFDQVECVGSPTFGGQQYAFRDSIDGVSTTATVAVVEEVPAIVHRESRVVANTIYDPELGVTWRRTMEGGNVFYTPVTNINVTIKEDE